MSHMIHFRRQTNEKRPNGNSSRLAGIQPNFFRERSLKSSRRFCCAAACRSMPFSAGKRSAYPGLTTIASVCSLRAAHR